MNRRRQQPRRARVRDVVNNANKATLEARAFIAQSSAAVDAVETKTLEELTNLLASSTETLEQIQSAVDMLTAGVTLQLTIAGKPLPVGARLIIDDEPDDDEM